jgi:hypothetical protein
MQNPRNLQIGDVVEFEYKALEGVKTYAVISGIRLGVANGWSVTVRGDVYLVYL